MTTAKEIKETVSLVDLLSRLGFEPVKKRGKEHEYFSMLHDETKPSFFVCDELGVWYDQGLAIGGGLILLGLFGSRYRGGAGFEHIHIDPAS